MSKREYAAVSRALDSILLHAELWGISPEKAAAELASHMCGDPAWEIAQQMVREYRTHRDIPEYWNRHILSVA